MFSIAIAPFDIHTNSAQVFQFLQILIKLFFFNSNHLNRYEIVSHCGFLRFFFNGPFLKSLLSLLQYCFCFLCSVFFFGWEACRILAPPTGIEPAPAALEGKVLKTGPPGKTLSLWFWLAFS